MFTKQQRIPSHFFRYIMKGKRAFTSIFRISYVVSDQFRFAVVIPKKKVKKRIQRNSLKRRIIHIVKGLPIIDKNISLILWVQKDISNISSKELKKEIETIFKKIT